MKKSVGKRLLAAAVTLALAGGLLAGCGSTGEKGESAAAQSGTTEKVQTETLRLPSGHGMSL